MQTSLVANAFQMAIERYHPLQALLLHSDRGCQYTSFAFRALLDQYDNIQVRMSRVGNCYDNALMESFFGTLKAECATEQFPSHRDARLTIFEFIEVWYNRQRLHSALDYLSPAEFELQFLDNILVC